MQVTQETHWGKTNKENYHFTRHAGKLSFVCLPPLQHDIFVQVNDQLKGGLFRYLRMQCGSTPFKRSTLSGLACKCQCTQFRYYKGQKKVKGLSHNKETKQISYAYHLKQKCNSFASRIDNSLKILLNYALVSIKTKNRLRSPTTTEMKKQTSSKKFL